MAAPNKETAAQWVTVKIRRTTHRTLKAIAKREGRKLGEVFDRAVRAYAEQDAKDHG